MNKRNVMLVSLLLLLCFSLLLTGCGSASEPVLIEDGLLVYPEAQWNATVDEVLSALQLSESDCTVIADIAFSPATDSTARKTGEYTLVAENQKFLGETAILELRFRQYEEDAPMGLFSVAVRYADDVDMAAMQTKLKEILGEPTEIVSDHVLSWDSEKKWTEFMSQESYQTTLTQIQALDEQLNSGNVDYFENTPAVRIQWTDDSSILAYNAHRDDWDAEYNQIVFTAPMVEALQRYQN